jgi:hypothetical protein
MTMVYKAPDVPGRYRWYWKLRTGWLGTFFGDDLIVE